VNFVANSLVSSSVSEEEKEQEVAIAMSLIMFSRDVRPWCDINSIAEFSDNNNHGDNDDNSLELDSPLAHLVSNHDDNDDNSLIIIIMMIMMTTLKFLFTIIL
jgi:hypothetical protein